MPGLTFGHPAVAGYVADLAAAGFLVVDWESPVTGWGFPADDLDWPDSGPAWADCDHHFRPDFPVRGSLVAIFACFRFFGYGLFYPKISR